MKNNNIRTYLFYCIAIYSIYFAIFIGVYVAFGVWVALIVGAVLYILSKKLVQIAARNTLETILTKELNAPKFKEVISSYKWFSPPMFYLILAEYYNGNYSKAISLIDLFLKKSKSKRLKSAFIFLKARIYFEQNDIEHLKEICDYVEVYKKDFVVNHNLDAFRFYRDYVEERYIDCQKFCNQIDKNLNEKSFQYKLVYANNLFDYAAVYYKTGDYDRAKEYFQALIEYAPQLYISKLSEQYLKAIDKKKRIEISVSGCNEQYVEPTQNSNKKILLRVVFIFALLLLIAPKLINGYKDYKYNQEVKDFEQKLCIALDEQYEEYYIVDYFNLTRNDEITDSFCIVKDEKGNYDIGFLTEKSNGEDFEFLCAVEDIKKNNSYCVRSMDGAHYVSIDVIMKNEMVAKDYAKTLQVAIDGDDFFIGFRQE